MEDNYKEVYFEQYCPVCKNKDKHENDNPCDDCLAEPARQYSHKPVNFEQK